MWNVCGTGDRDERRRLVVGEESIDVAVQGEVGEPVGVVGEEQLVAAEVPLHPSQPLADVRVVTGVDERDLPLVDVGAQQLDAAATVGKNTKSFVAHSS